MRVFERGETMHPLFSLGRLLITSNASSELNPADVLSAIERHVVGDWGELCAEDKAVNDDAILDGSRILSAYRDRDGVKFWVITEADRSATTVLLPDDY